MRAHTLAKQLPEREGELDRLRARKRGDDPALGAADQRLGFVQRAVPRKLVIAGSGPAQRVDDTVRRLQVAVREPALVAEPPAVDFRVVAGEDPLDFPLAGRRRDVAAHRAHPAHGRDVLDLPGTPLESVRRRSQRADRAELDHVAGEPPAVRLVLEGRDHGLRAAVARDQLAVFGDLAGEARAAVAEDAALAVERDQRADRNWLVEGPLGKRHPRVAWAVAKRQILERALAALVADRAVERVVHEDELERRVLAVGRLLGRLRRAYDHPVLGCQRATCLELPLAIDLDEAHAAGADRRPDPWLVAEHGDLDAGGRRGLD